jgi:hypothetical protein
LRPVATSSGRWSLDLTDVGDVKDSTGSKYTFWVVSASPNGSKSILRAFQELDGLPRQLPDGVYVMATGCAYVSSEARHDAARAAKTGAIYAWEQADSNC